MKFDGARSAWRNNVTWYLKLSPNIHMGLIYLVLGLFECVVLEGSGAPCGVATKSDQKKKKGPLNDFPMGCLEREFYLFLLAKF